MSPTEGAVQLHLSILSGDTQSQHYWFSSDKDNFPMSELNDPLNT
jgi:hypothetical protein